MHLISFILHWSGPIFHCLIIIGLLFSSVNALAQTAPYQCMSGQLVTSQLANTGQSCSALSYTDLTNQPTNVSTFTNDVPYLTGAALTPYLSIGSASSTYLTQSNASSTYLTQSGAASIYATQSALASGLAGKFNNPTGTNTQCVLGDGSIGTCPTIPRSFNNAPARAIQTVAAAGNGWQISTTRDSQVSYSSLITVTASISSGQSGYVVMEICPTNSSTAANWVEVGRASSSQVYTLAVAIQGVQGAGQELETIVPAGYFVRLRSVNVTGTPTFTYVSGQEVLL